MADPFYIEFDQALFGYSEGHRQLAGSVRLPSRDLYDLAAASDKATGAAFDDEDGYLTTIRLKESRLYAIIKTWQAPEMPRPGCVWSHVLLLNRKQMSSIVNLGSMYDHFCRPDQAKLYSQYNSKLSIEDRPNSFLDVGLISELILSFYSGNGVFERYVAADIINRAFLCVWSQQWPKLRWDFTFRTAALKSGSHMSQAFDLQVAGAHDRGVDNSIQNAWITSAANDATSSEITRLRRFLWRYGKDTLDSKRAYIPLIHFYDILGATPGPENKFEDVMAVFHTFSSSNDALTLKRDLLGLGDKRGAMVPVLPLDRLITIIADQKFLPFGDYLNDVINAFSSVPIDMFGTVAQKVSELRVELGDFYEPIQKAIYEAASERNLLAGPISDAVKVNILLNRPDLIGVSLISALSGEAAFDLLRSGQWEPHLEAEFLKCIFSHPPVARSLAFVGRHLPILIEYVVKGQHGGWLSPDWLSYAQQFTAGRLNAEVFKFIGGYCESYIAAKALGFPISLDSSVSLWIDCISRNGAGGRPDEAITLEAYVVALALTRKDPKRTEFLVHFLPKIREASLSGALTPEARSILQKALPEGAKGENVDKRILKALKQLVKSDEAIMYVINALKLNEADLAYVLNKEKRKEITLFFNPFAYWPWN